MKKKNNKNKNNKNKNKNKNKNNKNEKKKKNNLFLSIFKNVYNYIYRTFCTAHFCTKKGKTRTRPKQRPSSLTLTLQTARRSNCKTQ